MHRKICAFDPRYKAEEKHCSTVRREKLQESKWILGRALVGTVRKETPVVCCTVSESGMLGEQTQTSGVLNCYHPSRSLFSSAEDDIAVEG